MYDFVFLVTAGCFYNQLWRFSYLRIFGPAPNSHNKANKKLELMASLLAGG